MDPDHWGGKAQAGILKVGKLRLTGKSGTSPPDPHTPALGPHGWPWTEWEEVRASNAWGSSGGGGEEVRGVRGCPPSFRPGAHLGHRGGEQGGVQVGGGWVEAKIGDLSKMETR